MLVGSCQQKVTVKKMARIRQKIRSNICDVKQKTNSKERIHAGSYTHSRGTKTIEVETHARLRKLPKM